MDPTSEMICRALNVPTGNVKSIDVHVGPEGMIVTVEVLVDRTLWSEWESKSESEADDG